MGKASQKKKSRKPHAPGPSPITQLARDNVLEIIRQGRGLAQVLEIANSACVLAQHLTWRLEAENPLPQPLACQAGCDACCHNLVELTPPEALALGHHIRQHFADAARARVLSQVAKNLTLAAGKTKAALALIRRELPCPLLFGGKCSLYPLRPLVCRAMHGLNRERCAAELASGSLAGSQYYPYRHDIALAVSAGVLEGCRRAGCQSGTLDLARALHDFFTQKNPVERWVAGERVFADLPQPHQGPRRR
jgi:Fe-S-cluster containining protein